MPADASASVYATTLSPRGMSQVSAAMWDIVSPTLIGEHLAEAARSQRSPED